ncbi:beta-L-arabinofuranosidase domain-containing protein [Deminuibacter soli]|uniref:Glycosyl hydrolase n=1 Tax=Deminuibacter soli TaxID=2291815 RepID=A0A3E1NQF8_9BACT|nr:beta-L-arabinofuranosidase domain-containing protein [Deminuibacter soli]RFM30137.1 hypothetical protein DXN05_03960 [Deminuibacter soli]
MKLLSRRLLVSGALVLAGSTTIAQQPDKKILHAFNLNQVQLAPGSRLYEMTVKNVDYLLSLDGDRMLYSYRDFAGLDTKGAKGYGGWEWSGGTLRGEFAGHYLSACCRMYNQLKNTDAAKAARFLDKINYLVNGLAECQAAISAKKGADYPGHPGYLNAQSASQFDRLENLQSADVPFYIIHKILMGLLDAYNITGNKQALKVAEGEADYFSWRLNRVDQITLETMLNTRRYTGQYQGYFMEFGGMHDVLLELYSVTRKPAHLQLANKFSRKWFNEMLAGNEDNLGRNAEHSNSEVPCVVGMAHAYEITGDSMYKTGALNFLTWMEEGHEFSTGSISGKSAYPEPLDYGGELFNYPKNINYQVNSSPGHEHHNNGESCCSHNLNKLSEYAFTWTGDARWAGAYEKRFVNAVMAQQNPDDGMFIYNLDLKQGAKKEFGTPDNTFWCCYGSGVEAYAGLAEGAYFNDGKNGLWINRLLAGTLNWKQKGVQVTQSTVFPDNGYAKITFTTVQPTALQLHILIPGWAGKNASIKLNGTEQPIAKAPGSFAILNRSFKTGDVVEVNFPFSLATAPMPDAPQYVTVTYGPHVLVNTAAARSTFSGTEQALLQSLQPTGNPCEFTAVMGGKTAVFKPINRIKNEGYNGYTLISTPRPAQLTDVVTIGDSLSLAAHNLLAMYMGKGQFNGKSWIDAGVNGWLGFTVKVDPAKEMFLQCRYWGSDAALKDAVRLFDIEVYNANTGKYTAIATQYLEKQNPDNWYDVLYPIPVKLTRGQQQVQVRFVSKGFYGKPGVTGGLYDVVQVQHY